MKLRDSIWASVMAAIGLGACVALTIRFVVTHSNPPQAHPHSMEQQHVPPETLP